MTHQNELYVPIPVDVDAVKSKVLFRLTKRQLICFGIGIGAGVLLYFSTKNLFGTSVSGLLMMAIMLPSFFVAVYEKNGETVDELFLRIWNMINRPTIRPYIGQNCSYGEVTNGNQRVSAKGNRNRTKAKRRSTNQCARHPSH